MCQQADGVGAGAEEGGMAERDDAGIAEREIEREREQERHQQGGAEAVMVREREIEGDCKDAGQRFPPAHPMAVDQHERGRMRAQPGRHFRRHAHQALPPNRPCGRNNSSRIVSAKMNRVPPCGRYFFSAKSSTPMISAAKNTPVTRPSPPTDTTIRKYTR